MRETLAIVRQYLKTVYKERGQLRMNLVLGKCDLRKGVGDGDRGRAAFT